MVLPKHCSIAYVKSQSFYFPWEHTDSSLSDCECCFSKAVKLLSSETGFLCTGAKELSGFEVLAAICSFSKKQEFLLFSWL